jgi:hypothetical protein
MFANNWQIGRVGERASSGPEGLLKKAERVVNVATTASHPKADIFGFWHLVCFAPKADIAPGTCCFSFSRA